MMRRIDGSSEGFGSHGPVPAIAASSESCSIVHSESARSQSESNSLGTVLATMALLAVQLFLMGRTRDGIEQLVAQTALEAELVPLVAAGAHLLRRVHGLAALGTLGMLDGLERHTVKD
ncbi:hypothetical protein PFISCL1PPCAC_9866, partial [Pristionchus fissidentatus]